MSNVPKIQKNRFPLPRKCKTFIPRSSCERKGAGQNKISGALKTTRKASRAGTTCIGGTRDNDNATGLRARRSSSLGFSCTFFGARATTTIPGDHETRGGLQTFVADTSSKGNGASAHWLRETYTHHILIVYAAQGRQLSPNTKSRFQKASNKASSTGMHRRLPAPKRKKVSRVYFFRKVLLVKTWCCRIPRRSFLRLSHVETPVATTGTRGSLGLLLEQNTKVNDGKTLKKKHGETK